MNGAKRLRVVFLLPFTDWLATKLEDTISGARLASASLWHAPISFKDARRASFFFAWNRGKMSVPKGSVPSSFFFGNGLADRIRRHNFRDAPGQRVSLAPLGSP